MNQLLWKTRNLPGGSSGLRSLPSTALEEDRPTLSTSSLLSYSPDPSPASLWPRTAKRAEKEEEEEVSEWRKLSIMGLHCFENLF